MNNEPGADSDCAKGAVMLLGSLYWEGNDPVCDGRKGENRKAWRDTQVEMSGCRDLPGIPIRYGRRSDSRNGQFTIVLGGKPHGVAKIANLKNSLPVEGGGLAEKTVETLKREVEALAKAEGIWNEGNKKHYTTWGLVCIAINPKSKFHEQIRECWTTHFRPGDSFNPSNYGDGILDKDGILLSSLTDLAWKGLDFCLATPTKPTSPVPSAKVIAEADKSASYFRRTLESGIRTPDDDEIKKYLGK
jgi:hypothetical protein